MHRRSIDSIIVSLLAAFTVGQVPSFQIANW